ncbi:MAG: CoA-substrate-specific enzyme activase [Candidatus Magnetoglobus multicellularis str. Araruama]|uniref:CoA-substrate-specific enzyme activase n=1 Tax=Candidatus Magnetoglobus multicellularis str. Araruama TaxID=890399 RepID=A0A1V1P5D3_9BACT|nr:MAG: CoA-substrate-specific enzyme activase [Candidatus Magnetoglobus multicellularis str. Araruama]
MGIVAGCDVGSLTAKAVILKDKQIIASGIVRSKARPQKSAENAMSEALSKCGVKQSDIQFCVGTGYGRNQISFVDHVVSEITCHAKGAKFLIPSVKTIIDIGGQDCKIMKIDQHANVINFLTNDKCASGTGRFLEVMAQVLNIDISDLGGMTKQSNSPITLASTCTVWAQADVIKHINDGVPHEDIGAGINTAMANRVSILVRSIKPEKDICMTGGVAKNQGVISVMEKILGQRVKKIRKFDPQLAGAIGAAILAHEKSS